MYVILGPSTPFNSNKFHKAFFLNDLLVFVYDKSFLPKQIPETIWEKVILLEAAECMRYS